MRTASGSKMKWSLYAGVYAFLSGSVLMLALGPISDTLARLLTLPPAFSAFLLAAPAAVIGAGAWWAAVERRETYTYPFGALFGLLTALFTVLLWVLVFTVVWSPSLVLWGGILVVFVLAVSVPVAVVAGVPLMYARRRLDDALVGGTDGVLN